MRIQKHVNTVLISVFALFMVFAVTSGPLSAQTTHTVLAEDGTATWCYYCQFAAGALKEIDEDGLYDFYYVSHVDDMNVHSAQRLNPGEYNIYGFPTVYFDGGYIVEVGAGSIPSAKAAYIADINACGSRAVPDIEATLDVVWTGDAVMDISISVQNNEATTYDGHLRVFVSEIISSLGWYDYAGHLYHYPFLDYAFNEDISIPAGDVWSSSTSWVGTAHNDGHGHNFGGITVDNVIVTAAVYNAEWHQGYSYPPRTNPFDAYYVDEVVGDVPDQVVDDVDPEFVQISGTWNSINHANANDGSTSYANPGTGENKAGWRVDEFIYPGTYEVYTWKFEHPYLDLMATNAPFRVKDKNGMSSWVYVDQSTVGNEWVYLGTYEFDNSSMQGVMVTNDADGFVSADAVKLNYVGK